MWMLIGGYDTNNIGNTMIIFDMDGTLTLVGNRLKYLQQDKPDWDSFYEACGEDLPNEPIIAMYRAIKIVYKDIIIVTGRRESVREKTIDWSLKQGIAIESRDLFMRPNKDYRHDTEIKWDLIQPFKDDISLIFEDRTSVVNMWRAKGYTVCQVDQGDF